MHVKDKAPPPHLIGGFLNLQGFGNGTGVPSPGKQMEVWDLGRVPCEFGLIMHGQISPQEHRLKSPRVFPEVQRWIWSPQTCGGQPR